MIPAASYFPTPERCSIIGGSKEKQNMKSLYLTIAFWLICCSTILGQNSSNPLVGTWRLVETRQRLDDGTVRSEVGLGPHGVGYIIYTDTGVMCAFLSNPDRPKWKVRTSPTESELRSAFDGLVSYCGIYELNEKEGYVIHHVQMDRVPNVAGTERKRFFEISRNRLVLSPATLPDGIKEWKIVWERVPKTMTLRRRRKARFT